MDFNYIKEKLEYFYLILFICIIIYFTISKLFLNNYLINKESIKTKAVIINDKNVMPNGGSISGEFTYSYEFYSQGNWYKNDSRIKNLRVGDSIDIEYYPKMPSFNRSVISK